MKISEINDLYNPLKIWVVKITKCGHYFINQRIAGKMFYPRFQKMTKKQLLEIGLSL